MKLKRCDTCCGKFGLVNHKWMGYKFCCKACKNEFVAFRGKQISELRRSLFVNDVPEIEPV